MRLVVWLCAWVVASGIPGAGTALAQDEAAPDMRMLVLPLSASPYLAGDAEAMSALLLQTAHDHPEFDVLGPSDLDALLGVEAMKDALGCDDVSCAADIGGALGAPRLVSGTLSSLGSNVVLSVKLMDTRNQSVLKRASTRGPRDADSMVQMVDQALTDLFDHDLSSRVATQGPDYGRYRDVVRDLSQLVSNQQYAALVEQTRELEQENIATPPDAKLGDLLLYYRVMGCALLKLGACVHEEGTRYLAKFPRGAHRHSVEQFLENEAETPKWMQDEQDAELKARIVEINDLEERSVLTHVQAQEQRAYALFSAKHYHEAASAFEDLMGRITDANKKIEIVQVMVAALKQDGQFASARELLQRVHKASPRLFRKAGLHLQLRTLPRPLKVPSAAAIAPKMQHTEQRRGRRVAQRKKQIRGAPPNKGQHLQTAPAPRQAQPIGAHQAPVQPVRPIQPVQPIVNAPVPPVTPAQP